MTKFFSCLESRHLFPYSMNTLTVPRRHVDTRAEARPELTLKEREQLNDLRSEFGHQMNGTVFGDEHEELGVYWEVFDRNSTHLVHLGLSLENRLHHYKMLDHHLEDD